jgi:phosphoheptose isomerase
VAEAIALIIKNGESAIADAQAIVEKLTKKYPLKSFS